MEYMMAPSSQGLLLLLSRWLNLPIEDSVQLLSYVAALHDIGKAHPSLQNKPGVDEKNWKIQNYRHEQYGAEILKRIWRRQGWNRSETSFLGSIVSLHHQGKGVCNVRVPYGEDETAWKRCDVIIPGVKAAEMSLIKALTWQPRRLLLKWEEDGMVRKVFLQNGLNF